MIAEPRCFTRHCMHYRGVTELVDRNGRSLGEAGQVHWCFAFPSGIPERIAYGEDLHTSRARDQFGDVVFQEGPRPGETGETT